MDMKAALIYDRHVLVLYEDEEGIGYGDATATDEAKKQLAQEYPDIFGDDTDGLC